MAKVLNPKRKPGIYSPPRTAAELVERYARGERYFVGTRIGSVTKYGPNSIVDLSNASLAGANLSESRFEYVTLAGADLSNCNLEGSSLGHSYTEELYPQFLPCNLTKANLRKAQLDRSDLRGADLRKVNFEGASLCDTHLESADFSGADLRGARFRRAQVRFAKFDEADIQGTDFQDCIPPIPRTSEEVLREFAGRTCFLSATFFQRARHFDWLKPYVLLFDHLLFDTRATLEYTHVFAFDFDDDDGTWDRIQGQAIFLEDFAGSPDRLTLYDKAVSALRPFYCQRRRAFDKRFAKPFIRRMKMRGDGLSDRSDSIEFMGDSRIPDEVALVEFANAYITCCVLRDFGVPAGADALTSWLSQRVLGAAFKSPARVQKFKAVTVLDAPDLEELAWKDILDLRDSKFRRQLISKLDDLPNESPALAAREIRDALWRIATDAREAASLPKAVWKGIAGNLPLGPIPVNPLSLWWSSKEGIEARKRTKEYGWLFFLTELRERIASKENRDLRE